MTATLFVRTDDGWTTGTIRRLESSGGQSSRTAITPGGRVPGSTGGTRNALAPDLTTGGDLGERVGGTCWTNAPRRKSGAARTSGGWRVWRECVRVAPHVAA
jgi:hypothetical protein